jgi:hypothetical protein
MWELNNLIEAANSTETEIKGKWVPARPENYKPECCSLWERLGYAWQVVLGKAETFTWPEGQ